MPTEVIDHDAQTASVVPAGQDGKTNKEETVTISKAELDSIRRESQERGEAAQYWSGLHRTGKAPAEAVEDLNDDPDPNQFLDEETAGAEVEGDTPEKLVNEFAAQGVNALKSRGFITAKDAQKLAADVAIKVANEIVNRREGKYRSDAAIMGEFPDLKNKESDLFKETAKRYQKAIAMDPNARKTPAALYLAAEAASESLKRTAPRRGRDDEDDSNGEREEDRRRRADSQDGRPRGRGDVEDRDDMLGEEAKSVIKAMGITEEEFKKSQKETAGMGRNGRRR